MRDRTYIYGEYDLRSKVLEPNTIEHKYYNTMRPMPLNGSESHDNKRTEDD